VRSTSKNKIRVRSQIRSFCQIFQNFRKKKKWSLSRFCIKPVIKLPCNSNWLLVCWLQVIFLGGLKKWHWEVGFWWPDLLSCVVVSSSRVSCRKNKISLPWVCPDMKLRYQDLPGAISARWEETTRVCRSVFWSSFFNILLLLDKKESRLLILKLVYYSPYLLHLISNLTYWII